MSKPSLAPRVSRNFVVQEIVISSLNNEWQGEAKVHANARIRNTYSDCVGAFILRFQFIQFILKPIILLS